MEQCVSYSKTNLTGKCYNLTIYNSETCSTNGDTLYGNYAIVIVLLAIVTVPANLLVIVSLAREIKSTGMNGFKVFAISLAVTDLSVGLLCTPLVAFQKAYTWVFGDIICVVFVILDYGLGSVSVFLMTAMAFDRYKCVSSPLAYRSSFRVRRIVIQSLLLWISGMALWIPGFITEYVQQGSLIEKGLCTGRHYRYYSIIQAGVVYYIPLIVTVIVHIKLGLSLRERFRRLVFRDLEKSTVYAVSGRHCDAESNTLAMGIISLHGSTNHVTENGQSKLSLHVKTNENSTNLKNGIKGPEIMSAKRNISQYPHINSQNRQCIKICILVVITFIICWGPYCVLWPIVQTYKDCRNIKVYDVLCVLPYVNSATNPFIYILSSHKMRSSIKTRLLTLCTRNSQ